MDRLYVSANHYYAVFERFGFRQRLRSVWFWLFVAMALVFCWQGFIFLTTKTPNGAEKFINAEFLKLIAAEFIVIFIFHKLQSEKSKTVLTRINAKYRRNFSTIEQARRFLLRRYFGREESDYLSFSDDIAKAISYQEQFRNPTSFGSSQLSLFIYNPDSKQRIYALLLVVVSALTALSIHEGAGISDVFEFFSGENIATLLTVWLLLVLFLAGFLMLLLVVRLGFEILWSYLTVLMNGRAARNPYTLRYLQRDLLRFHRFVHLKCLYEG